jgi:hypothetical protein
MGFRDKGDGDQKAERLNLPAIGTHRIAIETFEGFKTREYGVIPRVSYRIVKSSSHEAGTLCGDAWWVNHKKPQVAKYNTGDFWQFIRAAVQSLSGDPANQELVYSTADDMAELDPKARGEEALVSPKDEKREHPARGLVLDVQVWQEGDFMKRRYKGVSQDEAAIEKTRRWIESDEVQAIGAYVVSDDDEPGDAPQTQRQREERQREERQPAREEQTEQPKKRLLGRRNAPPVDDDIPF